MKKLTCVDLFCGAGGFSYGLKQNQIEVVLANEIENDFSKTFSFNHPNTKVITDDIHNIDFKKELKSINCKDIDILCGGPPCQGFSTVGSKNKRDKRNSLFWEFLRGVKTIEPKAIIFENVSGFKNLYDGIVYETLIEELEKIGYKVFSDILDAVNYGLPQHRKRTIIVGLANNSQFEFPQKKHNKTNTLFDNEYFNIMSAISDLPPLNPGEEKKKYLSEPKNEYQKQMRKGIEILTEHNCSNYGERMKKILSIIPMNGSVNDLPSDLKPKSYFNNVYARLDPALPSPTITRNFGTPSSSRCIHPYQNRALSTREGARLQGFPDDYVFFGSKVKKNLQIGNAVPPILGEIIGLQIRKSLT